MTICSCYCSSFGGIYDTAKKLGLGEQLDVRLSRKELTGNGPRLLTGNGPRLLTGNGPRLYGNGPPRLYGMHTKWRPYFKAEILLKVWIFA